MIMYWILIVSQNLYTLILIFKVKALIATFGDIKVINMKSHEWVYVLISDPKKTFYSLSSPKCEEKLKKIYYI